MSEARLSNGELLVEDGLVRLALDRSLEVGTGFIELVVLEGSETEAEVVERVPVEESLAPCQPFLGLPFAIGQEIEAGEIGGGDGVSGLHIQNFEKTGFGCRRLSASPEGDGTVDPCRGEGGVELERVVEVGQSELVLTASQGVGADVVVEMSAGSPL